MSEEVIDEVIEETPVLNIPLIRKVMEHIEAMPAVWDQDAWYTSAKTEREIETSDVAVCGSTACFAGHALLLSGEAVMRVKRNEFGQIDTQMVRVKTGDEIQDFLSAGREVLGLTWGQANDIFYSGWADVGEMREHVERVIGERL